MDKVKLTKGIKRFFRNNSEGWMFVFPLFLGLAVFTLYPMIQSLIWSFYNYTGVRFFNFVSIRNYTHILTQDSDFWKVLGNTVFYSFVSVPIVLVTSYLVASLVNVQLRGIGVFRVLYYLPCIIPGVVSGLLWKDIFSQNGLFNQLLALIGTHCDFFESDSSFEAISSIFLMNLWSVGGGMILWLSAFKSIPGQLYESAKIDGAGRVQRFLHITIPLSMPMIFFNVVTMLIGTLQYNGTLVFANDGKGYMNSLYMFAVKIYNEAFISAKYGYASALSWILLVIIGLITAALFGVRKKLYMGDSD